MNEKLILKANILGGMDSYIREYIEDENLFEYWLQEGVPDESDEAMLLECAENDENFTHICRVFGTILKADLEDE